MAVPMGATHLLVPGLQPHIQYQFSVLAQNKLGSGPFSEIVLSIPEGKGSPSLHCTEKGWGGPGVGVGAEMPSSLESREGTNRLWQNVWALGVGEGQGRGRMKD